MTFRKLGPLLLLFMGLSWGTLLLAQVPQQTLRGRVTDATSRQPLSGAFLQLGPGQSVATDSLGYFRWEGLPVGRYRLRASYIGYDTLVVPDILLEAGREIVLELPLPPAVQPLAGVVVSAAPLEWNALAPAARSISNETTLRFPATFFDPARTVITFPGVVSTNDQANGLAVRGNSPNSLLWRLEGLDIVNPNHTANAGTFTDRATVAAGGVNMLSAQLLGNSAFYYGALPAGLGDALGGILDMRLRPGNNEKREHTLQVGLIGLDAAAEGPIGESGKASYLANYRYSTLGLLGALGVALGDEAIAFQDFSFHLQFPLNERNRLTFFGVGGTSSNQFTGPRDTAQWTIEKDRSDIVFRSRAGVVGLTYTHRGPGRSVWRNAIAASGWRATREEQQLSFDLQRSLRAGDTLDQHKINLLSSYSTQVSEHSQLRLGVQLVHQFFSLVRLDAGSSTTGSTRAWTIQPYLAWSSALGQYWAFDAGLHLLHHTLNGASSWEPRLALRYERHAGRQWLLAYSLQGQLAAPQLYLGAGGQNRFLAPTQAHQWVAGHRRRLAESLQFEVQAYYQHHFGVPVYRDESNDFSALNLIEEFVDAPLRNAGKGRNYGLEINLQQYFQRNFFYLCNLSLFRAQYQGSAGIWQDGRFDQGFAANLTGGKEWTRPRPNQRLRLFGLNGRLTLVGGPRSLVIDEVASREQGRTVWQTTAGYAIREPAFFRIDLRLYWKYNRAGRNNTLALDLQNATNQQNASNRYFDSLQGKILRRNQLGIIPILSYRIEF